MLTNFDIERLSKKLDLPLVGVFSKDELKNQKPEIGSYYINLMDSDKENEDGNNGSHWVYARIFSDYDDSETSDSVVICNALYFDPFGFGMPKLVSEFLKQFKPVYCNNREIQNINSTECGWYCIACDYALTHYRHSDSYLKDYEMFLNHWDDNVRKNLKKLKSFFNKLGIHSFFIGNH